jgi:hypothetical protein
MDHFPATVLKSAKRRNATSSRRKQWAPMAWLVLALVLPFLATAGWSQDNATITGTITDSSGALVPNATVNVSNPATGQMRSAVSNDAGAYRFANVGVGTYTLTVIAQGFEKFTRTGIVVNVAQTVEADAALKVGSAAQTVTVAADALQVQTETSEVSTLINGEQVQELSTDGRNVTNLAALGLGVSNQLPEFSGVNALTSANGISFNGTRSTHNIYLIDGGEQNDRGCGGCFMNLPSQDAIAEFQTLDSNYSPDYGIGSGGTIVMVLKSGKRDFHGEVYEFNRNTDYDANDYFTKGAGQGRPAFHLNEPGGNISGPLFIPHVYNENRTRTFFFWNEEWRRLIQGSAPSIQNDILDSSSADNFPTKGQSLTYTPPASEATSSSVCNSGVAPPCVPNTSDPAKLALYKTDGLTIGDAFPGSVIPANLIDQNAVLLINAGTFPKPNYNNGTQFIASIPQPTYVREDIVRIDHSISPKYQLMGHYLHDTLDQNYFPPLWGDSSYPTVGTIMSNPSYSAVIKLTQTYSANLLNESGVFYSGNKITLTPTNGPGGTFVQPLSAGWNATSFFPVGDNFMSRLPEIDLQGAPLNVNWSPSYYPWKNGYEGFEYRDDLSYTNGRHQFKFGATWFHAYKNQQLQYNTNGTAVFNSSAFSGDSYINFILGDASNFSQLQYLDNKYWVSNTWSFYANDNFHVTRDLTLNLGIRFDDIPHTYERYDRFANFVPADYDTALGNPVESNGTINPEQLSTFSATGSELFYLNGMEEAGVNGFPKGNVKNYHNSWQPRIGFADNLFGTGRTVLRGGFGMFFERVQGNDVYNAALNPPFAYIPSANNVYFSNPNTSALTGVTTAQTFPANMTNIEYKYKLPGTASYSLGIQHQVVPSVVAQIQYVGSKGWNQNDDRNINVLPLGDPNSAQNSSTAQCTLPNGTLYTGPYDLRCGVSAGKIGPNAYRNYPGFAGITQEEDETNFSYNAFQAGIRFENKHGFTSQLAYTWSHEIDTASNDLNGVSDPYNIGYDRASGAFDRRHIFNASYVYALPWFERSSNALERDVVGGWSISGITQYTSGNPLYVTYTGAGPNLTALTGATATNDTLGLGGGTNNRPNLIAKVNYPKKVSGWFTGNAYQAPLAPWQGGSNEGFGTAGRDSAVGPGLSLWNFSLYKSIPLGVNEAQHFELRFESFNTFNHPSWTGIDTNSGDGNFGTVTGDYGPRLLELGGKFVF